MRGATSYSGLVEQLEFISIHAPHAGRDLQCFLRLQVGEISIHAPHAGRDEGGYRGLAIYFTFQSTRPMRGATLCRQRVGLLFGISIHAPHAGRDLGAVRGHGVVQMISIHAPHAGRDKRCF